MKSKKIVKAEELMEYFNISRKTLRAMEYALIREIKEELNCTITVEQIVEEVEYDYENI